MKRSARMIALGSLPRIASLAGVAQNRSVPDNNRVVYPATRQWRGPETVLLNTAVSVYVAAFAVPGAAALAGGVASGSAAPVIFGVFWSVGYGFIVWTWLHLASRLEFSDGCLSWRCSLPWSPRMRPGRVSAVRWPASRRSRYVRIQLDDGRKVLVLPGPGLLEFINAVGEAEPAVVIDVRPDDRRRWGRAKRAGYIQQRVRAAGAHRSFRIAFSVAASLVLLGIAAEIVLTLIGAQENFRALRGDLAKVQLPPGYHLVTTRQAGTDCASGQCSIIQTWAWTPSSGHGSPAVCADVQQTLASAFSRVDPNSPLPANATCDYYAILGDLLHPGQGKRTVEAIVPACQAPATGQCIIKLTASYG